jgi:hypothetical protein
MESYLANEILRSLMAGDLSKFVAYGLVFFFIWLEVRGMKNQLKDLNKTVSTSFKEGEKRFEAIEDHQTKIELRLSKLESLTD